MLKLFNSNLKSSILSGRLFSLSQPPAVYFSLELKKGLNCAFSKVSKMDNNLATAIIEASKQYPKKLERYIGYGTAGFRDKENVLDHIMFRMGILANLRSKFKQASIGVMITASHNPEEDNGVKLVDPAGEMLENEWEKLATDIANADNDMLPLRIGDLISKYSIDVSKPGSVLVARDTRKSSPRLCEAVIKGVNCIGSNDELVDFGLASTPILHYLVVCRNTKGAYGDPTLDGYYAKLSNAFPKVLANVEGPSNYSPELVVDCANGVGAIGMKEILKRISNSLKVQVVNDGSFGALNHECGADFVKVQQIGPIGIQPVAGSRFASLDGDADRLIYFYYDQNLKFHMLDGDKIALLIAGHLGQLLKEAKLGILKLGVVQSAYANGSSTNYAINELGIPISCVPTGVKFLHHAAQEFDIGVYFEANGHGTVVFSDNAVDKITTAASLGKNQAAGELAGFINLINSTVGDAISDLLIVESILRNKGWSAEQWDAVYTDLPNRQLKVLVADRNIITTTDAERKCLTPPGLQERIDSIVAKYPNGRSFVRPSGTEDIVRVYAESDKQSNADSLGKEVSIAVYELCGGHGPKP